VLQLPQNKAGVLLMNKPSESAAPRILVVDDDNDSCLMLRALLQLSGYHVTIARTIEEGLNLASPSRFNLYILDNWFSDGHGLELCQQLRAKAPSIPILFYSGAGFETDIQEAMRAGADAYLVKPCEVEQIEKTIAGLLRKNNALPTHSSEQKHHISQDAF
jgi:DNA-binding response OmpR family regulator